MADEMTEEKATPPECDRCQGTGVRQVPYIGLREDGTIGPTKRTHEARCLCTYSTLSRHRDVVRGIFKKLAEENHMTDQATPPADVPRCPDCGSRLAHVTDTSGYLNADQFDAVKAGDFYCIGTCTGTRGESGKRYFWTRELADHPADPPMEPRHTPWYCKPCGSQQCRLAAADPPLESAPAETARCTHIFSDDSPCRWPAKALVHWHGAQPWPIESHTFAPAEPECRCGCDDKQYDQRCDVHGTVPITDDDAPAATEKGEPTCAWRFAGEVCGQPESHERHRVLGAYLFGMNHEFVALASGQPAEKGEPLSEDEIDSWRYDLAHVIQPERHSQRALATIDALRARVAQLESKCRE